MYSECLAKLLESPNKILQIKDTGVTPSAVRAGLNRALAAFNNQMSLLELPPVVGKLTVSIPDKNGVITIKMLTAPQAKFTFTIVPPEAEGEASG